MVSLLLSPGEESVCELGKGKGSPRARRDKDLKGAERIDRKRGDQTSTSQPQKKAAVGGEKGEELGIQGQGAVGLNPSSPH